MYNTLTRETSNGGARILRGGGVKITFDITFMHVQVNIYIYIVFEINLQNNNSFMCILRNI